MASMIREDPQSISVDVFLDMFAFLWEYAVRAMFIPGQIV